MNAIKCVTVAALIITSACEEQIIDNNTTSGFVTPASNGTISSPDGTTRGFSDSSGQGYAFKAGNDDDDDIIAVSGIIPGTVASGAPTSGNVIYTGDYQMVSVGGFFIDDGKVIGFAVADSGSISLNADFDGGTLRGSDDKLTIDGRISGNQLSGDVEYDGVDGTLKGVIGADKAVGAFHGNDKNDIYAGGFYATPDSD